MGTCICPVLLGMCQFAAEKMATLQKELLQFACFNSTLSLPLAHKGREAR